MKFVESLVPRIDIDIAIVVVAFGWDPDGGRQSLDLLGDGRLI